MKLVFHKVRGALLPHRAPRDGIDDLYEHNFDLVQMPYGKRKWSEFEHTLRQSDALS